jgi:hypothetical protein
MAIWDDTRLGQLAYDFVHLGVVCVNARSNCGLLLPVACSVLPGGGLAEKGDHHHLFNCVYHAVAVAIADISRMSMSSTIISRSS